MIIIDTEISIPTEQESGEGFCDIPTTDINILYAKEAIEEENSKIDDFVIRNAPSGRINTLHRTNNSHHIRSTRVSIRNNNNSYQNLHNRSISPGTSIDHIKASYNKKGRINLVVPMNEQNTSTNLLGSSLKRVDTSHLPPSLDTNFTPSNPDRYCKALPPQVIS